MHFEIFQRNIKFRIYIESYTNTGLILPPSLYKLLVFQEQGVDISRLALKFTVEQPGIATTLVSTARYGLT